MTYSELKAAIESVAQASKNYHTSTGCHRYGHWEDVGCCEFTQRENVDVLIRPPSDVSKLPVSEDIFYRYIEVLSQFHPDYDEMFENLDPTYENPEIHLCFGHALVNYQLQVLWRYLWAAPWCVYFLIYLYENGFTPAESLLILAVRLPWSPARNTTPYHIISAGCLVSPDLVLPLLESVGEHDPGRYGINSSFIHESDEQWAKSADTNEEKLKRLDSMLLSNFEKKGQLTKQNFLADLENLDGVREWLSQFA